MAPIAQPMAPITHPMAPITLPGVSTLPLVQPPAFAQSAHELNAVLDAQALEAKVLRQRLVEGQRECAQLRQRLRDSSDEVVSAAEAASSAAERLEIHAGRQGLVLAAGVERCSAERAALEHELQRMERLLWERDQEISRLQGHVRLLEATRLQGELELTGLAVEHQTANSEVRALGAGVVDLRQRVDGLSSLPQSPPVGPSPQQVQRTEETAAQLAKKQAEHAALLRKAEATAAEARRLESEGSAFEEHVRSFERRLRQKQDQMQLHDVKLVREAAVLREHCEQLRFILRDEQRDTVGVDQRAVLEGRASEEAESVRRELENTRSAVRGLVASLRERGRMVRSPEVPSDHLDAHLHAYLRTTGVGREDPTPPVVWRIGHGQYLIGEDRVQLFESHDAVHGGVLMVQPLEAAGIRPVPLRAFVHQQAQRAAASGRPLDI